MLKFGDIFFIEAKEYVWLYSDGKTIDAAYIFNPEKTKDVKRLQRSADRRGNSHEMPLFCYVELSTEGYVECSANMIGTKEHIEFNLNIRENGKTLDSCDLEKIKKEILDSCNLFKPPLVEFIKSI